MRLLFLTIAALEKRLNISKWNPPVTDRPTMNGNFLKGRIHVRSILMLLLIGMVGGVSWATDLGGDLRKAAEKGRSALVQTILDKGASVNSPDKAGNTALILAAKSGHIGTVKLLLDKGADVNSMNKSNRTALIEAAFSQHIEVVKLLLEKGADLRGDHAATPEWTPKGCCFVPPGYQYRSYKVLVDTTVKDAVIRIPRGHIRDVGVYGNLLFFAAYRCDNQLTQTLLEKGLPVDARDKLGVYTQLNDTPLIVAVHRYVQRTLQPNSAPAGPQIYGFEHPEACLPVVKSLLANGADVNVRGRDGRSALDLAIDKPELIELLKKK